MPSNDLEDPDPGNNANFEIGSDHTIGPPFWRTEFGEFENSESPYATYDQGGNVWEWNEAVVGSHRGLRGGQFGNSDWHMSAVFRNDGSPTYESYGIGFRVAEVPEPATLWLVVLCGVVAGRYRRH